MITCRMGYHASERREPDDPARRRLCLERAGIEVYAMRIIGTLALLLASVCVAQDSADFKPASSNVLDAQYPKVDSNSRVQIRFKAPDANKVRVNFWSG